jgi:hypothetical protein
MVMGSWPVKILKLLVQFQDSDCWLGIQLLQHISKHGPVQQSNATRLDLVAAIGTRHYIALWLSSEVFRVWNLRIFTGQ